MAFELRLGELNWISRPADQTKSPERGSLDRAVGRGKAGRHGGVGLFRREVPCFVESFQTKRFLAANKKPDRKVGLREWS